ncbi:MAG: cohesin domain-containing protein [Bryobacteraceae bacterium]
MLAFALIGAPLPLEAKNKKGDKYLAEGRAHEEKKEWDAALDSYEKALSEDPSELSYQIPAQKARFEASAAHVTNATKVRSQGKLGDALLEFQKAYALNPSSMIAEQEILRTQQMIMRERKRVESTGQEAPLEVRGLTPSELSKKENGEKIDRMLSVPELKPIRPTLIDFKINNQTPKVLFETVAKYAGLSVLWDPEYASPLPSGKDRLNVDFPNTTIEQALDYLALVTKSYWKPISSNAIFITMDTQNKRRDYEEEVTKVFYLTNVTSQQDMNDVLTAVRTVADCTRLFSSQSQNAIVAKCTADKMALADKIVHDLDKPRSEVVVDIFVMEVSSSYLRSLTAALASTGLNVPFNFTPRTSIQVQGSTSSSTSGTTTGTTTTGTTTTTTGTSTTGASSVTGAAIPLSSLGHLASADFSTTLPSALLQATLSDTRTKVLQSPQMRSVDGQKATMKIGEREPTASGSFGSTLGAVAGAGISPLVNTQFQYIDVGVNVEITPHVHDNGEVSLHVSLDISNVTGNVNLGGINQPIIGQRKMEHDIRLREGEVSLLGGLLNQSSTKTRTGIPGLANIPILGRLFSGDSVDNERDELMIALIPHVVRRPEITEENLRSVASGNQTTIHVSYGPRTVADTAAPKEAPVPNEAPPPANPAAVPASLPATTLPATAPPEAGSSAPQQSFGPVSRGFGPPATAPPEAGPGAPQPLPAAATVRFDATQLEKSLSDSFTISLQVDGARNVVGAPIQIQFDPKAVSLTGVTRGSFWGGEGDEPTLTKNVLNDSGSATIRVLRKEGSAGITGSGPLINLTFKAQARGATIIRASGVTLETLNGPPASGNAQVTVNVK